MWSGCWTGVAGVRESAVVGHRDPGTTDERVHAVLVLEPGTSAEAVVAPPTQSLPDHQRIRSFSVWAERRAAAHRGHAEAEARRRSRAWVDAGARPAAAPAQDGGLAVRARAFAGRAHRRRDTSLEALGLSSLERVELMVALEDRLQTRVDETRFASARTIDELQALLDERPAEAAVDGAGGLPPLESPRRSSG